MAVAVRPAYAGEARLFLELHGRAVRGLADSAYPADVIEAWAPPVTEELLQHFSENRDEEIRLIAELDGVPVGVGALVVASRELRACYVVPEGARRGVGRAIVDQIECIAREHGLDELHLVASVNAQAFYERLGYVSEQQVEWMMRGQPMAAVRMRKAL